eukprot:2481940-Amphidinium_carterae.1
MEVPEIGHDALLPGGRFPGWGVVFESVRCGLQLQMNLSCTAVPRQWKSSFRVNRNRRSASAETP